MKPTLRTFFIVLLFMMSLLLVSYWFTPTASQEAAIPVCGTK